MAIDDAEIYLDITKRILSWIKHPAVMQEWRKQVVIAFRRSLDLIGKPPTKIQGLVDLPYLYFVLAVVHDKFDKINRIINLEVYVQWPESLRTSYSAALCQIWLEYVKTDLIQKGLLQSTEAAANLSETKESEKLKLDEIDKAIIVLYQQNALEEKKPPTHPTVAKHLFKAGVTSKELSRECIRQRVQKLKTLEVLSFDLRNKDKASILQADHIDRLTAEGKVRRQF